MSDLTAEIQLRPTRIGFLVHPADLASVRWIMRACARLWGGVYNPIIPVFNKPPTEWKSEVYERFRGAAVAKGYVRFNVLAYNIKRVMTIMGVGGLLEAMRA
jgi:hypothetical protein